MDSAQIQDEYRDHRDELLAALDENRKLAAAMDFAEVSQILDQLTPMSSLATTSGDIVMGQRRRGGGKREGQRSCALSSSPKKKWMVWQRCSTTGSEQRLADSAGDRHDALGLDRRLSVRRAARAGSGHRHLQVRDSSASGNDGGDGAPGGRRQKVVVPALDRRDEIGGMAKAVEVFKANLIERVRLELRSASGRRAANALNPRKERRSSGQPPKRSPSW